MRVVHFYYSLRRSGLVLPVTIDVVHDWWSFSVLFMNLWVSGRLCIVVTIDTVLETALK
jgi:hypothetical protein